MKDESKGCLTIVGLFAIIPFLAGIQGWSLSWLWFWFISTPFGIKPITIWEGFGIALVVGMLVPGTASIKEKYKEDASTRLLVCATSPLLSVALGWMVFHWGMGK